MKSRILLLAATLIACVIAPEVASAATYTFTPATGNWSTTTSWSPNGTPGAADTVTSSTNASTLTIDTAESILNLQENPAAAFTVNGPGVLTIGVGGQIGSTSGGGSTFNFNAPLVLGGTSATLISGGGAVVNFGVQSPSTITGFSGGASTLFTNFQNNNTNSINSAIVNGAGGPLSFVIRGVGLTLALGGSNTYTGPTTFLANSNGGGITLSGSGYIAGGGAITIGATGSPYYGTTLTYDNTQVANALRTGTSAINLFGSGLTYKAITTGSAVAGSGSVGPVSIAANLASFLNTIAASGSSNTNTSTFTIASLTGGSNSTLVANLASANATSGRVAVTDTSSLVIINGIIPSAVETTNNLPMTVANISGTNYIGAYGSVGGTFATSFNGATSSSNVKIAAGTTLTAPATVNSLTASTTGTIGLGGNALTVNAGAIVANTANAVIGANGTDGSITTGAGIQTLYTHAPVALTINSPIINNGSAVTLIKDGSANLTLGGSSTYTGATYVLQGGLVVASGGSVADAGGMVIQPNGTVTVNAGGSVGGTIQVNQSTAAATSNLINSGSISGTVTIAGIGNGSGASAINAPANSNNAITGNVTLNGGSFTGNIIDNGQLTIAGSTPVTVGTISTSSGGVSGAGAIYISNTGGSTLNFANNSSFQFIRPTANAVATLTTTGSVNLFAFAESDNSNFYNVTFGGGIWNIGQAGQNNTGNQSSGILTVNGGATVNFSNAIWAGAQAGSFLHGIYNVGGASAGTLTFNTALSEGNGRGTAPVAGAINGLQLNVNNGGVLTVAGNGLTLSEGAVQAVTGTNSVTVNAGGSATFGNTLTFGDATAHTAAVSNQINVSGGLLTLTAGGINIGTAATAATANYASSLNISSGTANLVGNITLSSTFNAASALTNAINLSGGKLLDNGIIASNAPGTNQSSTFNWTGGQLTALTFTAANFGGAVSGATLTNSAGLIAPGDNGLTGKTTINGNYITTGGTTGFDINGAAASGAYQDTLGSGKFDLLAVTGTAQLGGALLVNNVGGYTPPNSTTNYQVMTFAASANGTAPFSNTIAGFGGQRVFVNGDINNSYLVTVNSTNLTLGNYLANQWVGGNGNYSAVATSGTGFVIATATGARVAVFGNLGTSAPTVNIDSPVTLNAGISFTSSSNNYTLSSVANALTLGGTSISVAGGSQSITAPVVLNANQNVTGSGALNIGGSVTGPNGIAVGGPVVTLSGSNGYTGATTVNSGTLNVTNVNGVAGSSSLAVNGGLFSIAGGAAKTVTLGGNAGTALTLANAGTIAFGLYNGGVDTLSITSGSASVGSAVPIGISQFGAPASGTYNLITDAAGGLTSGNFTLALAGGYIPGFNSSLNNTSTALQLALSVIPTAYWQGGASASWTGTSNFTSDAGGTSPLGNVPGVGTDVIFSATGAGNQTTTTVGTIQSLKSLTINDTSAVGITTGTLNIAGTTGATGITVNAGAGAVTISSAVNLNGTSNVVVNNAGGLAISGAVGGSNGLVASGTGKLTLSGVNTYSGGTTLGNGITVTVNSDTGLGGTTGGVTFDPGAGNNATLQAGTAAISLSAGRAILLNSGTATLDASAQNVTVNGSVSGAGALNALLANGKSVQLQGPSISYAGLTTVTGSGGTVGLGNGTATSFNLPGGALVGPFATLQTNTSSSGTIGALNGAGTFKVTGAGAVAVTVAPAASTTSSIGTLQVSNGLATVTINPGANASQSFGNVNGSSGSTIIFAGDPTSNGVINSNLSSSGENIRFGVSPGAASGNWQLAGGGSYLSNITINSGNITTSTNGQNFNNFPSVTITGGTFNVTAQFGIRFGTNFGVASAETVNSVVNQSGGLFISNGNEFSLGGNSGTDSVVYNLSGGTIRSTPAIVLSAAATGTSQTTFNFSGGKIVDAIGIQGQSSTGAQQAFIWTGGTMSVGTYNATNLVSATGVGVGATTNTLVNGGGILAPGDSGVAGKTTITGNYFVSSANASLAVDLLGTTQAGSFQVAGGTSGYDTVAVSGSASLGGALSVNLSGTGGTTFAPTSANSFTILTGSGAGAVSGAFTNTTVASSNAPSNSLPRVIANDGLTSFSVNVSSSNVVLGTATKNEWLGGGNWGSGGANVWTAQDVNGAAYAAAFGNVPAAGAQTVTLDANRTVQGLLFTSTGSRTYNIVGSNAITLDNTANGKAAYITDSSTGGNTIAVPVVLNSNVNASVAGSLAISGSISGVGGITKSGAGTLAIQGNATYGGPTTITGGVLLVSGSLSGNGTVTVDGALGGSGYVAGAVNAITSGTIAPGIGLNTAGTTLSIGNNVSIGNGATLAINLDATNTLVDLLAVTGGLNLTGNDTLTINLVNGSAPATPGQSFVIATFTAGETGTFANYDTSNWVVNYGANNITITAIPEPGTWAMLIGGAGMLLAVRRRRIGRR